LATKSICAVLEDQEDSDDPDSKKKEKTLKVSKGYTRRRGSSGKDAYSSEGNDYWG
jgi:hypothetical protein